MKTKKITVIVCTYNREEPLCNFLRTLLDQSIDDFEILLIDQTVEHTQPTIDFLERHADRIRVIHQETPNLPMARNTGLRHSSGEYIVFADDDLLLPSNCLDVLIERLEENVYAGVTGIINPRLALTDIWQQYLKANDCRLNRRMEEGEFEVERFIGALMVFRKEIFDKVGLFDEAFGVLNPSCSGEDTEFCRRVRHFGLRLAIDPRVIVEHEMDHLGGCAAREGDTKKKLRQQLRAGLYIEMKYARNPPRIGPAGWLGVIRGGILNRDILLSGPFEIARRLQLLKEEYADVRNIYHQQQANSCSRLKTRSSNGSA